MFKIVLGFGIVIPIAVGIVLSVSCSYPCIRYSRMIARNERACIVRIRLSSTFIKYRADYLRKSYGLRIFIYLLALRYSKL